MSRGASQSTSQETGGFGLRLVGLLAGQLGGNLEMSSAGPGTEISVTFPLAMRA